MKPNNNDNLVDGFNPLQKYDRQIGSLPQFSGWKKHVWVATTLAIMVDYNGPKLMKPDPIGRPLRRP